MDLSNPITTIIPSLEGVVLQVLSRTSAPVSGSRIATLTAAGSNAGVRVALSRLVRQGLVISTTAGPSLLYTANRVHVLWPAIEHAVNSANGVLDALQERVSELVEHAFSPRIASEVTVALFGSVARGTSTPESDIDLVVVVPDSALSDDAQRAMDGIRANLVAWTGNTCNIYALNDERLKRLVAQRDEIVGSWEDESRTWHGPELRRRILDFQRSPRE